MGTHPNSMNKLYLPIGVGIFVVITVACFTMHFFARGALIVDTPLLVDRLKYMVEHRTAWQLMWLNWMVAALGLLLFACMLREFVARNFLSHYALLLMALGIAPDISGECIYAFILPLAYERYDIDLASLQLLEVIAMNLTGTVGNGFYNVGGLILNTMLLCNTRVPKWVVFAGLPAWPLGIALSVSTALAHYPLAEIFTAAAMFWSTVWILIVSLTLFKEPEKYLSHND